MFIPRLETVVVSILVRLYYHDIYMYVHCIDTELTRTHYVQLLAIVWIVLHESLACPTIHLLDTILNKKQRHKGAKFLELPYVVKGMDV